MEEDFSFARDCIALDQSQARLHTTIARHAVLVMATLTICVITAAHLKDRTALRHRPLVNGQLQHIAAKVGNGTGCRGGLPFRRRR